MPNLRPHAAFLASHFTSSRASAFGRHREFSLLVVFISAKAYFTDLARIGQSLRHFIRFIRRHTLNSERIRMKRMSPNESE
jgi:hypothetical protein